MAKTRGPQKVQLSPDIKKELAAFLTDSIVVSAQNNVIGRDSKRALKQAVCWARISRESWTPRFFEFLFFYDLLVQNGERWISRSELQGVVEKIILKDQDGATREERIREKIHALAEWLAAGFAHIGAAEYRKDALLNSKVLLQAYSTNSVTDDQLRLLYLAWFRAVLVATSTPT